MKKKRRATDCDAVYMSTTFAHKTGPSLENSRERLRVSSFISIKGNDMALAIAATATTAYCWQPICFLASSNEQKWPVRRTKLGPLRI